MALIGYARTSTIRQDAGLSAQVALLTREGVEPDNIYSEKVSSVAEPGQLEAAVRSLRRGDVLIVTKLDRLARSLEHAITLERQIAARGASVQIVDPATGTSTPIGRLLLGCWARWRSSNGRLCWNGSGKVSPRLRRTASTRAGLPRPGRGLIRCWRCVRQVKA